jgi:hypothetical protein
MDNFDLKKYLKEGFQHNDDDEDTGDGFSGFRGMGQTPKGDNLSGFRGSIPSISSTIDWREKLTVYTDGFRSAKSGKDISQNPFTDNPIKKQWWEDGWKKYQLKKQE